MMQTGVAMLTRENLKPLGPYFIGQIVDYIGRPSSTRRRYRLSLRRWHVLQTESQQEGKVEEELDRMRFGAYCPRVPGKVRIIRERYRLVMRPMLTGYLFVGFDPIGEKEEWQAIRKIRGVIRLFMIDERPVPVGDWEMQCVRHAEQLERAGKERKPAKPILPKAGDLVQAKEGPFTGFFGFVTGSDQRRGAVKVELDIFGRATPVEFEGVQVEVVLDKPAGLVALREQYKRPRSPR